MPDPTKLQRAYDYLKSKDVTVPADYSEFEAAFAADADKRQKLYDYFKSEDVAVPDDYNEFEASLLEGVKKKEQAGSTGSEAGSGTSFLSGPVAQASVLAPEPVDEGVAVGAGAVPAEVATQPSAAAEQLPQPMGMSLPETGMTGQFDALTPGRAEVDYLGTRTPQLTQQSADALQAAGEEEDGFWATLGKSLRNTLDPRLVGGNLLDYAGDMAQMLNPYGPTAGFAVEGSLADAAAQKLNPVTDDKITDRRAARLRDEAKADALPVSDAAKQSVLDNWQNPAAWGNLLGQGAGSIVQVGVASALGGPGAGVAAGAGLSISSTKEAAREAGVSDKEAAITATVLAPVVGVLEELGLGFITKNAAATKILQKEIIKRALAYGEGKITKVAVIRAASELLPEVVKRTAKGAATGAVGEAGTEFLQGVAEGETQVLADQIRGNDTAAPGNGRYGTTQGQVFSQAAEGAIAGALLGGAGGGISGAVQNAPQQAAAPVEATTPAPAPAPQFTVPADITPDEQARAAQAYPQPVAVVRPTGQVEFSNVQVVGLSPDGTMARIVGEDTTGNPVDTTVQAQYLVEQPTVEADGTEPQSTPQLEGGGTISELDSGAQAPTESQQGTEIGGQPNQYDTGTVGLPAELPGTPAQPNDSGAGEFASDDAAGQAGGLVLEDESIIDVTGQDAPIPAEEPATQEEAPAEPVASTPEAPSTNSRQAPVPVGRTLTPAQQAGNDVLDMWDDYKALNKTQQKGKPGQALRKQMAAKADAAGLTVTTAADGTVTVTRDGKRATRTNGLSGTSEVDNFVPAQQRTPAVRDAALHLAAKVQQGGSEFTGMGVQINSKNLNPRDAKAAAKDIQEGRNTYRAALLLEEIEASLERGYFAVSTGTGLSTQKFEIPTEDFLGEAAVADIRSKQPAPLSDPELDALIAEDATVQQAIQEYGNEDGSIDVARLSADAAGKGVPYLQFMFGLSEETATKFLALTNERASQTTQEAPVTGSAAKSSPEPDGTDSGSGSPTSTQEEVAPAKPTLREQNEAAKAALSDALAEFRAARKKKGNKAYSSVLGVTPFSEEEAAALVKMVKALVKLGAVNSRRVIAGLRAGGFDENDGTDDQLRPLIRQVLKDEGVFRAKSRAPKADAPVAPTTGTATTPRASMEKVAASPAFSDATKAAVKDAGLNDYTPRSQADAVAAVEAYMQRVSLDEAVSLAASDSTALRGDVRTALRQAVLKALNDQMRVANDSNDTATAERLLEDVLRVATAYAGRGTDAGQEIAAYNLMHRFSPEAAVVQAVKQTREKADQAKAAATQKVPGVAKRARAMQKEVVEATVKSEAVAKAKAALSGDPAATTTKEPTAYGARNKFFTKEKLAALRKATGGMLFAAPVSPVVIYEGAYHLEAGVRQFAEWSKKMVRSYGAAIRPRLAEIYDLSKAEYVQQGGDPKLVQSADEVADAIAQEQAEMLATRIQQLVAAPAAPGLKDPVQQLLDTLTAKVREKLVPQPGKTKVAPREAILHALRNQEEYAAVWELAKEQVEAALSADPTLSPDQRTDLLDRLSGFYQETIGQAYATKQAADVVRSGLKELGARLDDIVRRHATEQVDAQVSLVSKLVAGAGLTPQEAQSYAAVVQKEFQRQVQAKRDTILNRLRAKIGVPPTPRKGKTALDKLFETLNLSPITDARVTEILMEQLELPTLTAADVDRLRTLADKVQAAKGERAKSAAVHELLIAQKQIAGITKGALVQAWWYANILSNYTTHIVNFVATGQNVAAEAFLAVGNVAWRKPTLALAPLRGLAKGLRLGVNSAYDAMGTGVSLPRSAEKFDTPNDLEAARDRLSLVLRYVPRLLKASDTFWQSGLREMRAYELAVSEALAAGKTRPTAEIWTDAHNRLYGADALLADAQATARQELPELGSANPAANLLREAQYQMRVHELFTAGRDKALAEAAVGYAAREAFNGELEGGLGYVMSGVSRITEWERGGVKPIKFIIPFVNIITNVTNKTLDWTPYGYVRAVRGSVGIGMGQGPTRKVRQFTAEERGKLAAKATMGALAIGAALAHLTAESISAAGPDEPEKKKLLQQTGWQPYSLHLGDKWVSYKETPLYFALAAVATLKEDEAYNGRSFESDATGYADRAFLVTFAGLKATVMNTPLKSVQELLDVFSTQGPGTSITDRFTRWGKRTVAYSGQALIPLSSLTRQLLRDYEAVMNLPRREANTVVQTLLQDVPGAMGRGGIAYDQLGNPQMVDTDRLVSEAQYRDEDTKKIHAFLLENKVSLPACNRNQSDLAVVKGLKLGQLTRAEQAEYERLPTKQQKQYLAKKAKHIGPMSDAEWSAFYQKRGELLKASLLAEMEDRSFPGTTVVREGLQSLARSNPRAMVQLISELATDAKAQALEFVIKDRSLNPAQYPPDESDDE